MKVTLDMRLPRHEQDGDYALPGSCGNCGWRGMLRITKGERAPGFGWTRGAVCPICGCDTVTAQRRLA